ncbi:hypothetical protein FRC07_005272 [Ceratobasidium sp. 392]|nr:hypothetical protein FRC07_005272 [Ceratobasidium sp. 392]
MKFLCGAMDESHTHRNSSLVHRGILKMAENSHLLIGATATPLFTSPRDLAAQGRILRYEPLMGDAGEKLCGKMMDSMRDRGREWEQNSADIVAAAALQDARRAANDIGLRTNDSRFQALVRQAELRYENDDQMKILRTTYVSHTYMERMRDTMRSILVRRTGSSRDPSGEPVLDLPPCTTSIAWSPKSPSEQQAVDEVNEEHQRLRSQSRSGGSGERHQPMRIKWSNFLLDQKYVDLHPGILPLRREEVKRGLKQGQLVQTLYQDWTAENLLQVASTRLLTLDRIFEHYWAPGNPKPPVFREDGTRDLEAEEKQEDPVPSDKLRKFLVYVEFSFHRNLVTKMLSIKDRGYVCYNGSMTKKQQQKVVDRFTTDPTCRIMIISNVGAARLNLTAASIVLFLSGQSRRQISRRCWRMGQEWDVVLFLLLAPGGIDLALCGYADAKTWLSDSFLISERELCWVYQAVNAADSDDSDNSDAELALVSAPKLNVKQALATPQPQASGSSGLRPFKGKHKQEVLELSDKETSDKRAAEDSAKPAKRAKHPAENTAIAEPNATAKKAQKDNAAKTLAAQLKTVGVPEAEAPHRDAQVTPAITNVGSPGPSSSTIRPSSSQPSNSVWLRPRPKMRPPLTDVSRANETVRDVFNLLKGPAAESTSSVMDSSAALTTSAARNVTADLSQYRPGQERQSSMTPPSSPVRSSYSHSLHGSSPLVDRYRMTQGSGDGDEDEAAHPATAAAHGRANPVVAPAFKLTQKNIGQPMQKGDAQRRVTSRQSTSDPSTSSNSVRPAAPSTAHSAGTSLLVTVRTVAALDRPLAPSAVAESLSSFLPSNLQQSSTKKRGGFKTKVWNAAAGALVANQGDHTTDCAGGMPLTKTI